LTSKKNSRSSLKQWVTTIRRYEYELPRLYEKLEYLKVRSIGYSSPSFEPKFGGRGVSNNYSIDYWLERIEACETQIKKREQEIRRFKEYTSKLDEVSKDIIMLHYYHNISVSEIVKKYGFKTYKLYYVIKTINNKFDYKRE